MNINAPHNSINTYKMKTRLYRRAREEREIIRMLLLTCLFK